MPTTNTYWKDQINDLRNLAHEVITAQGGERMNARTAAQVLSGVVGLVVVRWSLDVMQRTCADLVRHSPSWATDLGRLPTVDGVVTEPMQLVATVARGVLPVCGKVALKQALSYWACESDTASWACLARHR